MEKDSHAQRKYTKSYEISICTFENVKKLILEVGNCLTNHIGVTLVTLQMCVTPVTFW